MQKYGTFAGQTECGECEICSTLNGRPACIPARTLPNCGGSLRESVRARQRVGVIEAALGTGTGSACGGRTAASASAAAAAGAVASATEAAQSSVSQPQGGLWRLEAKQLTDVFPVGGNNRRGNRGGGNRNNSRRRGNRGQEPSRDQGDTSTDIGDFFRSLNFDNLPDGNKTASSQP